MKSFTDNNIKLRKTKRIGGNLYCANEGGISVINIASGARVNFEFNTVLRINDMDVDTLGNIWIATQERGLVKLGKAKTEYLNTSNSNIPSDNILAVKVERFNKIWIGHDSGAARYDGKSFTNFSFNKSKIGMQKVDRINFFPPFKIFSSTKFQGMSFYNDTSFSVEFAKNFGLSGDFYVYDVAGKPGRDQLIATSLGLIQRNPKSFKIYNQNNGMPAGEVATSVYVDSSNSIWIGTKNAGLLQFDGKKNFKYFIDSNSTYSASLTANHITGTSGNLFISTNKGLIIKSGNTFTLKELSQNGISIRAIDYIAVKSNNTKYFEADNQLGSWDGTNMKKITTLDGITNTTCILHAKNGDIFIGTNNLGLQIYIASTDKWVSYSTGSFLNSSRVNHIVEDDSNVIWICTPNGLIKYQDGFKASYSNSSVSAIPTTGISKIAFDKSKNLFFATNTGLLSWDKKSTVWKYWDKFSSKIQSNNINDIVVDERNVKIMATDIGIIYFDTSFVIKNSSNSNIVNDEFISLAYDTKFKKLYFGTKKSGLGRYYQGKFRQFSVQNSNLRYNNISCIAIDQLYKVYIGYGINGFTEFVDDNKQTEIENLEFSENITASPKHLAVISCPNSTVVLNHFEENQSFQLYNLEGKLIQNGLLLGKTLQIGNLNAGMYIIKAANSPVSYKLIIQ